MYVILREKKKKLFYKNIHYMCLNYIKIGKPIYQLQVLFGKQSRYIGSKVLKGLIYYKNTFSR